MDIIYAFPTLDLCIPYRGFFAKKSCLVFVVMKLLQNELRILSFVNALLRADNNVTKCS